MINLYVLENIQKTTNSIAELFVTFPTSSSVMYEMQKREGRRKNGMCASKSELHDSHLELKLGKTLPVARW